jgi:hypothetical protein
MDELLDFLKGFNLQTILSMAAIIWYFTRDIKSSIDALDHDVRKMNTRVGRLEGTVYGRDIYSKVEE